MAYKIIVQHRAEIDINEAFIYISEFDPEPAIRWYRAIKAAIIDLGEMPGRCAVAPESGILGFELRQLIYGNRTGRYRVIFRIVEAKHEVHVVAVRHGSRKPLSVEDIE